jgi:ABC-type transporter Mla maintaining outer membrane lipid asymmetry ATPase subunit MlaF
VSFAFAFELIAEVADMDDLNTVIVVTHDVTAACSVTDHLWLIGHGPDEDGKVAPGSRIVNHSAQGRPAAMRQFIVSIKSPAKGNGFERTSQAHINIGVSPIFGRNLTFCIGK